MFGREVFHSGNLCDNENMYLVFRDHLGFKPEVITMGFERSDAHKIFVGRSETLAFVL